MFAATLLLLIMAGATYYRYFPTKEDVVFDDEFDAIDQIVAAESKSAMTAPSVAASVRNLVATVLLRTGGTEAEQLRLTRLRLIASAPALQARQAIEERRMFGLLVQLIADSAHRQVDDVQVRLATAAVAAVQFEASRCWAARGGEIDFNDLINEALTMVEPLLNDL